MKAKLITKNQAGFSTLEILIAFVVATLCITAVVSLVFGSQKLAVDSQTDSEASHKAQAMLEDARATAIQNFDLIVSKSYPQDDIYQKTLSVVPDPNDPADDFKKLVTATVTWTAENNRNLKVQLATFVTNPVAAAGGDTCNPTLSGDWAHPQLLGYADVGQNNGGTDVYVSGKKAYITTDPSANNISNFYIVDVSNPNLSPLPILGSVDTNPTTKVGLAAIYLAGKYAYVANMSTVNQLQVIDISVPSAPTVVAGLNVAPDGVGNSIFYANKKIYLGLTKSSGSEFYVIDVSNPTSLSASSIKANFEINSKVNAITVKNNIAYLSVPDDSSTSVISEQLKVLDVSQADSGTVTALNPYGPNPSTMSGEGLYISKDGNTLYLGQGGANSSNPVLFSLDVTSPNSISKINSKYIGTKVDGKIGITVNAITVRSNLAFLWTNDTNLGFQIWDLNNLSSPTPYGSLNTQQTATGGFYCDGNFLYTAQRSQKALQIIGPGFSDAIVTSTIYNNANGQPVTSVPSGTVIYDKAVVTGSAGTPTGNVDFILYTNKNNCSGTSQTETITLVSGVAQSSTYLTAGKSISYKVHYYGDANYNTADGACKPLIVN